MFIPTAPIGSIPRPPELLEKIRVFNAGRISVETVQKAYDEALRDTIKRFEATGSPVISDGEQNKSSFVTYPLAGLPNLTPDGVVIPFADGHSRRLPQLSAGPFRYANHAGSYLAKAKRYASVPVKQAVISASALSLLYPPQGIVDYPEQIFLADVVNGAAADIRGCLAAGAHCVQIDFTEGRLAQLGTTDDCGFSPFEDDTSTGRDTAFAKIHARVLGTNMAAEKLATIKSK